MPGEIASVMRPILQMLSEIDIEPEKQPETG